MAAIDADRIMLVRHTYIEGWYLPGGAIGRTEDAATAATRELEEEAAVRSLVPPDLFQVYRHGSRSHVALYVTHTIAHVGTIQPNWEIAEAAMFPLSALPAGATPATRRRIEELDTGVRATDW